MDESTPRQISLDKGKVVLVSAEDHERITSHPYPWRAAQHSGRWYAVAQARRGRGAPTVFMHRLVLNAPPGIAIDHIDGNGLNNHRSNLRLATASQNGANRRKVITGTSKFKGVSFHKGRQNWQCTIIVRGKKIHLGTFLDETAAALAYDVAAKHHFGEFARTNF